MSKRDAIRRELLALAIQEGVRCPSCQTRTVEILSADNRLRCRPCVTCSCGKHASFITEGTTPSRLCSDCHAALSRHLL